MSARSIVKSDYVGFTYGTKADGSPMHSSELGIVRVSDGSRFNENLLPTMQDKTVQIPGGDGTYYFGSYYTQRQFSISFAFDNLTEAEIATLKAHFGDKGIHNLIFDETPYKVYQAKVTGTATIKYLAFDEGANKRVYKGEGTVQFTCYDPFARCAFSSKDINDNIVIYKNLDKWKEELRKTYPNIDEWWDAARFESNKNFGDVEVPFTVTVTATGNGQITTKNGTIKWTGAQANTVLNTRLGVATAPGGQIVNDKFEGDLTMKLPVGAEKGLETNEIVIGNGTLAFTCLYF